MNAATVNRLQMVYPELERRLILAIADAARQGFTIEIDQGVRTWPEQTILWQKGRNAYGVIVDHTQVVTHARAGESYHNYGLAVDFVPFDEHLQPIWDRSFAGYATFIAIAESYNLLSGSRWPEPKTDFPHLELTGRFPENAPDTYCKYLFEQGGFVEVWKEVDLALGITT